MSAVFRYCIHRVHGDDEVVIPISDLGDFLSRRAIAAYRDTPLRIRLQKPEAVIAAAVEAALDEAFEVVRVASLRV